MYVRLKIFSMGGIDLKPNYNISLGNKRLIMVERSERKSRNKYALSLTLSFREGSTRTHTKARDTTSLTRASHFQ